MHHKIAPDRCTINYLEKQANITNSAWKNFSMNRHLTLLNKEHHIKPKWYTCKTVHALDPYSYDRVKLVLQNICVSADTNIKMETTQVNVLCPYARHIFPLKVLVIPRKRWLRPNMTETLFTGTLTFKQETTTTKQKQMRVTMVFCCVIVCHIS